VRLDYFSVAFLTLNDDRPSLSALEADELQNSHMAHLADLHDAGHLLVAGPLEDDHFRGLCIFKVTEAIARRLLEEDPAVRAGRFNVTIIPWVVPEGTLAFSTARFPRSIADVE
jgi:uncharacterized protein YciI